MQSIDEYSEQRKIAEQEFRDILSGKIIPYSPNERTYEIIRNSDPLRRSESILNETIPDGHVFITKTEIFEAEEGSKWYYLVKWHYITSDNTYNELCTFYMFRWNNINSQMKQTVKSPISGLVKI